MIIKIKVVFSSVLQCITKLVFFKEHHKLNAVDIKWERLLVSLLMHTGYHSHYTKTSRTLMYVSQPMSVLFKQFAVCLFPVCQISVCHFLVRQIPVCHFPVRQISVFHCPVLQFPPLRCCPSFSSPANSDIPNMPQKRNLTRKGVSSDVSPL